ncbi:MAG: hypothetical protein JWM79_3098 [Nocardioides sp.]|nr:hypothetical protein [Nocardioides sp.]
MLAAGSMIIAGVGATGAVAAGDPDTDNVIADNAAWYEQAYENFDTGGYLDPEQGDVAGPQRAPFGTGSHQINIGQSSAQTELYRTDAYDGLALSDLTRLEYSTLARSTVGGADRQPAYLRLSVDTVDDGTDSIDASLFFFPANNGAIANGVWQNWDVTNGAIDVNGDGGGTTTLAAYAAAHPDAKLVNVPFDAEHDAGAVSLIVGGSLGGANDPQTRGEYFVDRVIVGESDADTLYDLGSDAETSGGTTNLTVDADHLHGWAHQAYDDVNYLSSNQTFVNGPAGAPLGAGSLRFALSNETNPARVELFRTTNYDGTLLRDLRTMDFSTFQRANAGNATPQQPAYARLSVDNDGDGATDDSLFYYPGNNGVVQQSTWQSWHAADGVWGVNGDPGPLDSITLAQYVVAHPDATIVENADVGAGQPTGGVAFLVGGGNTATQLNGEYFVDAIKIGKVDAASGSVNSAELFDLEPAAPSVSIGDAAVSEGNHGATLTFPVTLSGPAGADVAVDYATSDDTAVAGEDYEATSGTLTIEAGDTTGQINVPVLSDKVREGNEKLTVTLSSPGYGTLNDSTATGTILNDDTRVGLALRNARGDHVGFRVNTLPDAPGDGVKVFQTKASGRTLMFQGSLNGLGRLNRVMEHEFKPGTRQTFVAVVRTENGSYRSKSVHITVR